METNRFETFFDAIIAIIITVLVLKIPQPTTPTLAGIMELNTMYMGYLISFLILYNIWYANHDLFQLVDEINNRAVWIYGVMTFVISLLPYFTIWVAYNTNSVPAETMFGLIFILTHILTTLATIEVYKANPYNKNLQETNLNSRLMNAPLVLLIIGFILTYTVYVPGIYVTCLISIVLWILIARYLKGDNSGN
ncbi:TMEM175 family protein [Methanobrevibacter sp.]